MADPIPLNAARRKKKGENAPKQIDGCPITPIGHRDGVYMFFDIIGQYRELKARELGVKQGMTSLFNGDVDWLWRNFAAMDRNNPEKQTGFNVGASCEYLMRLCGAAGLFGDHISIRRHGIWRGDGGEPVVNAGDVVIGAAFERAPPLRLGNAWIGASEPMPRPTTPCGPEIARDLLDNLRDLWDFRDVGSEIAIMGWIGSAYLGAAPQWRPNLFLTGSTGSGKSMLLDMLCALMPIRHYTNDTSKAGIEQAVGGRAMPIFVDEAADRVDQHGARSLMDLVLASTGGKGAQGFRGSAGGQVRKIEVVGAICMASVAMPAMQTQHRSRFTVIETVKPEAGADHKQAMLRLVEHAGGIAQSLWGRALAGWSRYNAALEAFRAALATVGRGAREMDHLSAILAGWWVLTEDRPANPIDAMGGVSALAAFLRAPEEIADDDTSAEVMMYLLTSIIPLDRTSERASIASLLERAFKHGKNDPDAMLAARYLLPFGIKVSWSNDLLDDGDGIWLSRKFRELQALFDGSPFDGDRWLIHLKRVHGVRSAKKAVRYGKTVHWPVFVPKAIIFPPEDEAEADD